MVYMADTSVDMEQSLGEQEPAPQMPWENNCVLSSDPFALKLESYADIHFTCMHSFGENMFPVTHH